MEELKIIRSLYGESPVPEDDCFFKNGYLYTTDSLAEGTHFLQEWSSPRDLAHKLLHVNLSDIVASGGSPEFCFLTLGLSEFSSVESWILEFSRSFREITIALGIQLVGGDTYFSNSTNLGLTLVGRTERPIFRSGGREGDFLYCTGDLGLSFLGFELLRKQRKFPIIERNIEEHAIEKHLRPNARRLEFRKIIERFTIHAAMDCTDGLTQDLEKLAKSSGLKIHCSIDEIPGQKNLSPFLSTDEILGSGEELEILFLSPDEIPEEYAKKIGSTMKGDGVIFTKDGNEFLVKNSGFYHFKKI